MLANNFLESKVDCLLEDGRQRYVRIGTIEINYASIFGNLRLTKPRIRDRQENCEINYLENFMDKFELIQHQLQIQSVMMYLTGMPRDEISSFIKQQYGDKIHGFSSRNITNIFHKFTEGDLSIEHDISKQNIDGEYVGMYVDATYINTRNGEQQCIMAAVGIDNNEQYKILGLMPSKDHKENQESYSQFFQTLIKRGLKDPDVIIADDAPAIWNAATEVFPKSKHQKCFIHKCRNIFTKISRTQWESLGSKFKSVFKAKSKEEAKTLLLQIVHNDLKDKKTIQKIILDNIDCLLTYFDFNESIRSKLYTSNPIETIFSLMKPSGKKTRGMMTDKNILFVFKLIALGYASKKTIVDILAEVFGFNVKKNGSSAIIVN
jgi:transposase-like protein